MNCMFLLCPDRIREPVRRLWSADVTGRRIEGMADQEKIRLMTRAAILEKTYGKQIRRAGDTCTFDLVTNPVWRRGFFVTLIFFVCAGLLAVLNMDMVLNAVATDQTTNLIMIVLIAYLSLLSITVVISLISSWSKASRMIRIRDQYYSILGRIQMIEDKSEPRRGQRGGSRYESRDEDENWAGDEEDGGRKRRRRKEELDYRNMLTLEFEDDDYSYYVEATPKKRGKR